MAYRISVTPQVERQLEKFDKQASKRIIRFLHERVAVLDNPRSIGKALKGARLGEFWRYRVGDYRIFCDLQDNELCVLVVEVGNRKEVYR